MSSADVAKAIPAGTTPALAAPAHAGTAFGCARDFLSNRFVYAVVSPRARGLSVGVNLNPDRQCNFDCAYCEVDRSTPPAADRLDVDQMAAELERTLDRVLSGAIREQPGYGSLPADLVQLRHVTLSGDGEPTLCDRFVEVVETVVHLRALGRFPFFKIVLVTNGTGLDRPGVEAGLRYFTASDEIWIKLDAGTQAYMNRINRPDVPIEHILGNILRVGRQRPVVIQSLFAEIEGQQPSAGEIDAYAARLATLRDEGARIALVQVYSANRPTPHHECRHLSLTELSQIAQRVRAATGLKVEVF